MSAARTYGAFTIFVCLFCATGGFLFGYDVANIGGILAMPAWLKQFGYESPDGLGCGVSAQVGDVFYCITSTNKALITSFLSIGTFFGALSGAWVADVLGRRGGLITASTIFGIGALIQTAVTNIAGLVAGRVITGAGVGLISMMVPMMQAEVAPAHIRGSLVAFYQLSITIGILVAQGVDLGTANLTSSAAWRVPIGLQMLWSLIIIVGCLAIPESPRFLVTRGKVDEARASLARLRGQAIDSEPINTEMAEIQGNYEYELSLGASSYAECFKGNMLLRTMCGILVQMFQQLTGVNFIFYYGTSFFIQSGISQPYLITVATGVVNVGMTIPGIWMVERFGRRNFLIGGALWMSFCNLIVGATAVGAAGTQAASNVLVVFTLLFIAGFASTWGPGAWVLISELYPLKLRGKAMSMATASNWWWNWVIAFAVPYITDPGQGNLGSKIAFIWFATSFGAAVWTYFYVPETKGHTLEALDEMFEAGLSYRQTPGWKPSGLSLHGKVASDEIKAQTEKAEMETTA